MRIVGAQYAHSSGRSNDHGAIFFDFSRKCTIARSPRDHASDNLCEKCCTKMVESSKMDTISLVLGLSFVIQDFTAQNWSFFETEIRYAWIFAHSDSPGGERNGLSNSRSRLQHCEARWPAELPFLRKQQNYTQMLKKCVFGFRQNCFQNTF